MATENTSHQEGESRVSVRRNVTTETESGSSLVPTTNVNVPANERPQQPAAQPEPVWKTVLYRIITFWIIMQVVKSFTGKKEAPNGPEGKVSTTIACSNLFKSGDELEMFLFYSESKEFNQFDDKKYLLWHESYLFYGNWYDGPKKDGERETSGLINISDAVKNNGSLYYHTYFVKQGYSPDPKSKYYSRYSVVNQTKLMTTFRKQRIHKTKNLLTGKADPKEKVIQKNVTEPARIISYWHPNITINLLDDQTPWQKNGVPSPLDQYVVFDNLENFYYPVLYLNDYWNYVSDYMPINETTPQLEYHVTFSTNFNV